MGTSEGGEIHAIMDLKSHDKITKNQKGPNFKTQRTKSPSEKDLRGKWSTQVFARSLYP